MHLCLFQAMSVFTCVCTSLLAGLRLLCAQGYEPDDTIGLPLSPAWALKDSAGHLWKHYQSLSPCSSLSSASF